MRHVVHGRCCEALANLVQLTNDGHRAYLEAVEGAFGADIDYAQLVKIYGASPESAKGRYSPADCTGIVKTPIEGKPDPAHISTSFIERQNLTMRMHMRRFTRLTNAFSKKVENHAYAVARHQVRYRSALALCVARRRGAGEVPRRFFILI
jgi:3-methyladenine DNA glycosylase/8-oxoguanine DNA glycosylase